MLVCQHENFDLLHTEGHRKMISLR